MRNLEKTCPYDKPVWIRRRNTTMPWCRVLTVFSFETYCGKSSQTWPPGEEEVHLDNTHSKGEVCPECLAKGA